MKKIAISRIYNSLLVCIVGVLLLFTACKKERIGAPVITSVRNYQAAPNDTVVQTIYTGQWVILLGQNLNGVTQAYFGTTPATINTALLAQGSLVVQVPAVPFPSVPGNKLNEVTVVSETGSFTYSISITGPPIISYIKSYQVSPVDTISRAIYPDQKINIRGYNLKNATRIAFQGVAANLSTVVYTDTSVIVQVPADLSGGDATLANTISYTTNIGTGSFSIQIIGPPIITGISYEIPNAGDSVYLYGNNFFSVQSLVFAGVAVTSFIESADGTSLGFIVPSLTQSGPVKVTTQAGTFTTAFNVNDITSGAISNFEWNGVFKWDWWGGASLECGDPNSGWPPYNPAFPGNSGQYLVLKSNALAAGGGDEFSTAIRIGGVQWLPAANLTDPVNSWALKFETNIPGPWNGGTLSIKSSSNNYRARFEPWEVSPSSTVAYSTKGWKTITIPLSSFRKNDAALGEGKGTPITSISELLGNTGTNDLILYLHNYASSPAQTGFNGAFDNLRVVKR
jgi:hypothetical protein